LVLVGKLKKCLINFLVNTIISAHRKPDWIPAVNPNNKLIDALFSAPPILLEA